MPTPYSKLTTAQKARRLVWSREWRAKHPGRGALSKRKHYFANREKYLQIERDRAYRKLYGISISDYDSILKYQNGSCAICGASKPGKRHRYFSVDHCHKSGTVRGLLCVWCNVQLGRWEKVVSETAQYLQTP